MGSGIRRDAIIAQLDRWFVRGDYDIKAASEGVRFDTRADAEKHARTLADEAKRDAAIVRGPDGAFWVFEIEELAGVEGVDSMDGDVRGNVVGTPLPGGAALDALFVSPHNKNASLGAERILARGAKGQVDADKRARDLISDLQTALAGTGSAALIDELRGTAPKHALVLLRVRLEQSRTHGSAEVIAAAERALPYLRAAVARCEEDGRDSLPYEEVAAAPPPPRPPQPQRAEDQLALTRALGEYPAYAAEISAALTQQITALELQMRAASGDQTALRSAHATLSEAQAALKQHRYPDASQRIAAFLAAATTPGLATHRSALQRILVKMPTTAPVSVPSPDVLQRAASLLNGFASQSQVVINALFCETYVPFYDTLRGDHLRAHDGAVALLRINTCIWTVLRDLRNGRLPPEALGASRWSEVSADSIYACALRRLEHGLVDYDKDSRAMLRDPVWADRPTVVNIDGQSVPLSPDTIGSFWKQQATFTDNYMARLVTDMDFVRIMRQGATAIASSSEDKRAAAEQSARIDIAHKIYAGGELAPNATQALVTMAEASGVPLVFAEVQPAGTTRAQMDAKKAASPDVDFIEHDGRFVLLRHRPIRDVAADIRRKVDAGNLRHLATSALAHIRTMTGPDDNPGATLQKRITGEDNAESWRQFSNGLIIAATAAGAAFVTGGAASGLAFGLGIGAKGTAVLVTVASSAAFTTTAGLLEGHIDPTRYPIDLVMFGALRYAGRFAELSRRLIRSQSIITKAGRAALGQTAAVSASTTVLTGFGALEMTARGRTPSWQELKRQFGHNLASVAILHGVNLGLARIAPGAAEGTLQNAAYARLHERTAIANAKAQAILERLDKICAEAAQPGVPPERAERLATETETLMRELDVQRVVIDGLRTDLVAFARKYLPERVNEVAADFGRANPDLATAELTPQQRAVQQKVIERFMDVRRSLGLDSAVLDAKVNGVSAPVVHAFVDVLRSPLASIDVANIQHLASVFRDAAQAQAKRVGRPLTQAEVDRCAMETVLTDIWFKGATATALASAPTAPTTAGATGADLYAHMKAQVKRAVFEGQTVAREVRALFEAWIDRGFVPMKADDARAAIETRAAELAKQRALTPQDTARLKDSMVLEGMRLWTDRVMKTGQVLNAQGFMLGTWLHGIPAFSLVQGVVESVPGRGVGAQQVYEAVLGHHMAGFVAAGLGRAQVRVEFDAMEATGQLSHGGAARLARLYETATTLATKWRARIDAGLTAAERQQYWEDSAPLRAAIEGLLPEVRQQLLSDDAGQFTTKEALAKWLDITQKGRGTTAEALGDLIEPVQGYLEEARGRDADPNPAWRGRDFVAASAPAMERLGITLDAATGRYRIATPGESAYVALAERLAADAEASTRFRAERRDGEDIVQWLRRSSPDRALLRRLATDTPPQWSGFLSQEEVRVGEFRRLVASENLTPDQIAELFRLTPATARDPVTDFARAEDRIPMVARVIEHVRSTGHDAYYVEADIANLGGLNARLGHSQANGVYRMLTDIMARHLRAVGADVHFSRHGGDEVSAVIVGREISAEKVERAVRGAQREIESVVADTTLTDIHRRPVRLADIEHPKYPGDAGQRGTGLSLGVAPIHGRATPEDVFRIADLQVEAAKLRARRTPASPDDGPRVAPTLHEGSAGSAPPARGVTGRPDRAPFLSEMEARRALFVERAQAMGMGREHARDIFQRAGGDAVDPVTGFELAYGRVPTLERAIKFTAESKGERGYYVEVDLRNLGGLNKNLGHSGADRIYARMAQIIGEELHALEADTKMFGKVSVTLFRHGGDEVSAVIVGPELAPEVLQGAMERAQRRIADYVAATTFTTADGKTHALANIDHPKHPGDASVRGTGIVFGMAELQPTVTATDTIGTADRQVELKKTGGR